MSRGKYEELAQVLKTPLLQSLLSQQADVRTKHAAVIAKYGPNHPEHQQSQTRVDRVSAELQADVRQVVQSERARLGMLEGQEQSLLEEIETTKANLLIKEQSQAGYSALAQELRRSEGFLKSLASRQDELDLSSRTQLNNARVVQQAISPSGAVSPRPMLNLLLALVLGTGLGIALGFMRYYVADAINTPADVENYIRLPFLGLMPRADPKWLQQYDLPDLATYHDPNSGLAEAARGMRAMIEFRPSGSAVRRLMVVSSIQAEGKTSTCIRLGIAFAQYGKRVLLIDADQRRARVHKALGVENDVGVLALLAGEAELSAALKKTAVPNLTALPLGPRRESASALLASPAMSRLLEQLDEHFDLIIIDTPPAAALTEAFNLAQMVDGLLFVLRSGVVSRRVARHTAERFKQVEANILGVVLNDVDPKRHGVFSSYYYYGYRYYGTYDETPSTPDSSDTPGPVAH
jgi:capsular exopolysaccharide synthesis family protein